MTNVTIKYANEKSIKEAFFSFCLFVFSNYVPLYKVKEMFLATRIELLEIFGTIVKTLHPNLNEGIINCTNPLHKSSVMATTFYLSNYQILSRRNVLVLITIILLSYNKKQTINESCLNVFT